MRKNVFYLLISDLLVWSPKRCYIQCQCERHLPSGQSLFVCNGSRGWAFFNGDETSVFSSEFCCSYDFCVDILQHTYVGV